MNDNEVDFSHKQLCMMKVETKAVITVKTKFAILLIDSLLIIKVFFKDFNMNFYRSPNPLSQEGFEPFPKPFSNHWNRA